MAILETFHTIIWNNSSTDVIEFFNGKLINDDMEMLTCIIIVGVHYADPNWKYVSILKYWTRLNFMATYCSCLFLGGNGQPQSVIWHWAARPECDWNYETGSMLLRLRLRTFQLTELSDSGNKIWKVKFKVWLNMNDSPNLDTWTEYYNRYFTNSRIGIWFYIVGF